METCKSLQLLSATERVNAFLCQVTILTSNDEQNIYSTDVLIFLDVSI